MYIKLALTALLVCTLYNSAYSNIVECIDNEYRGLSVSYIKIYDPPNSTFKLRAPEFGETVRPISCIALYYSDDLFHAEITKGGFGKNFVELNIYPNENRGEGGDRTIDFQVMKW